MAAGGDVKNERSQRFDNEAGAYQPPSLDPFAEKKQPPPPAAATASETRGGRANDDEIAAIYAHYDQPTGKSDFSGTKTNSSSGYGSNDGPSGAGSQSGVDPIPMPRSMIPLFGEKFGSLLFFAESVKGFFKGFFSPNEFPMMCFVTSGGVYLGDDKTGELVVFRSIDSIQEVQSLGDTGIGLRCRKGIDLFIQMPTNRPRFVEVLQRLASNINSPLATRTLSIEGEKSFKKGINYADRKECSWTVVEDPRTGVVLVEVPEQHKENYAPLVPKILYWFGGVNHSTKGWRGPSLERRGCWLTATALFLCKPGGPQTDGRDITRCIGVEFIETLLDGSQSGMGIIPSKDGPPQPHLALQFDSPEDKMRMVNAITSCYLFRKKAPLKVQKVANVEAALTLVDESKFKPHLFVMKTRADLYGLLRGKT